MKVRRLAKGEGERERRERRKKERESQKEGIPFDQHSEVKSIKLG